MIKRSQRKKMPPSKLHVKVMQLLKARNCTLLDIHKATRVEQGWLSAVNQGRIQDPSANRLEPVYEFLTGKRLEF